AETIWLAEDEIDSGTPISPDWRHIDVGNLSYEHAVAADASSSDANGEIKTAQICPGLKKIAIALKRGERIALVGPSGAGKSTLMRVLAGQYSPRERSISVDGMHHPAAVHLGSIATLIPQEADVFDASIRDNLSLSGEHADDEIAEAVHASAFDAVMVEMSLGLETLLSERGSNLSGGQR